MKNLILASVSALALFGVAACSDTADNTTTQSVPQTEEQTPAPATPAPETGTGGAMQNTPTEPAPAPAPAQ